METVLALTNQGIEDIAASEIEELGCTANEKIDGGVVFSAEDFEGIFRVCYKSQSVSRVMLILSRSRLEGIESIKKCVDKADFKGWADKSSSFVCRSEEIGKSRLPDNVEPETGGFVIKKTGAEVELENPDTTVLVVSSGNECFLGIDFSGPDIAKREYRIFKGAEKTKANVAYSLVRMSGFRKGMSLLDPFCSSGTVPIETALFESGFSPRFFSKDRLFFMKLKKFTDFDFTGFFDKEDKKADIKIKTLITAADRNFNAISSTKKNAKIAGIQSLIDFSRKEHDWLDLKFRKKPLDVIVSVPPQKGKSLPENAADRICSQLFEQASIILKKRGRITVLMKDSFSAEKAAEKNSIYLKEKRCIMQGSEKLYALCFEKK